MHFNSGRKPVENEVMWDFLRHVLGGQNQFASGGLLLMLIGSVGVFLRALPQRIWWWVVEQSSMTITVKDDDTAFVWVKEWFLEQPFMKRIRQVDLDTTLRGAELALIPAPGDHWFWHAGRPFWVEFYRSEEGKKGNQRRMESLTFRTLGRDRRVLPATTRRSARRRFSTCTTRAGTMFRPTRHACLTR